MFCAAHTAFATDVLAKESFEHMKTLTIAPEKTIAVGHDDTAAVAKLCARVGSIVVHALGTIDPKRDDFHSERYIFPQGYFATRIFWSAQTPRTRTVYILKVDLDRDAGRPVFSITPGDDPDNPLRSSSADEVYSTLISRVKTANRSCFSKDVFSKLPVPRKTSRKAHGLNGPQFFGFGLDFVRKALEQSAGAEAVAAPLTKKSVAYKFCFHQPPIDAVMALQRKRAAVAAEQALENASGSARTEGMEAVTQSTGSGRITRALVRSVEDDIPTDIKRTEQEEQKAKADRESNQRKYNELKSAPLESRLVARRSHIHGWGLFTKVDLPKDSMIVEYMGETVYRSVADKREKEYEKSGIGSCYMFRLDLQRIVDATMIGCMARFMNHCCRPNAYAKIVTVDTELGPDKKIVVFSNRDIAAGEEITYDYKFPVEDGSLKCTCGAPNCIGRMN
jgi:histone-lysine N-methyltransferase SETD1